MFGKRFGFVLAFALTLTASPRAADFDPEVLFSAVVALHAEVPSDARTAEVLGTERAGSGVVIDSNGLVLTIGYLILEASKAEIRLADGRAVPTQILAYDHESGFGLLRALQPLDVEPMRFGESGKLEEGTQALVSSFGGPAAIRPAKVVSRRVFAGYWEYLLESAIFTSPPHPNFGGAALVGPEGKLLGIGSLVVGDAKNGEKNVPGNMFVPIDELKPILADLMVSGRSSGPHRPWLGIYAEEARGRLFVTSVADEGPAENAGLNPGDIILAVGSESVGSLEDFYRKVWASGAAGVDVELRVLAKTDVKDITLESIDRYAWLRLDGGL